MKIAGDYSFDVPRETVWRALLDPKVLQKTLPGCEELKQIGENEYEGRLKMKVGPVQGVFEGKVALNDLDAPNGYSLKLEGKGTPGFLTGDGRLELDDSDSGGTVLRYDIEAQVGGRIASIGQRLLDSSAKVITKQGLKGLDKQIQLLQEESEAGEPEAGEPAAGPEEGATASVAGDQPQAEKPVVERPTAPTAGLQPVTIVTAALLIVVILVLIGLRTCGGS